MNGVETDHYEIWTVENINFCLFSLSECVLIATEMFTICMFPRCSPSFCNCPRLLSMRYMVIQNAVSKLQFFPNLDQPSEICFDVSSFLVHENFAVFFIFCSVFHIGHKRCLGSQNFVLLFNFFYCGTILKEYFFAEYLFVDLFYFEFHFNIVFGLFGHYCDHKGTMV